MQGDWPAWLSLELQNIRGGCRMDQGGWNLGGPPNAYLQVNLEMPELRRVVIVPATLRYPAFIIWPSF